MIKSIDELKSRVLQDHSESLSKAEFEDKLKDEWDEKSSCGKFCHYFF